MILLRSILVLTVLLITSQSFASTLDPHQKILRAKERYVKTTQLGRLHANFYEQDNGLDLILFGFTKTEFQTKKSRGKKVLRLNWALRSASLEYLSWILFQGLVRYDLEKKLGGVKLPMMIEMDFYIFKKSMEYLDQSGMVINSDIDFSKHPTYNFGRERLLSIELFYELWLENEDRFLSAVWERRQKLDKKVLSVMDYLGRRNLKKKERAAAEKLKALWFDY